MYTYKMIQVPPNVEVEAKQHKGNEAAYYLESIVNEMSLKGWEFYRIDQIGVKVKSGCLRSIFGTTEEYANYNVITFRRPS